MFSEIAENRIPSVANHKPGEDGAGGVDIWQFHLNYGRNENLNKFDFCILFLVITKLLLNGE